MPKAGQTTIAISTGTIFRVLLIGLALWFLWYVKEIVVILVLALMLSALIDPAVGWLNRHKIPRALGVLGIYAILFAVVSSAVILIIPPFVEQLSQLLSSLSTAIASLGDQVNRVVALGERYGIAEDIQASLETLRVQAAGLVGNVFATITSLVGGMAAFVIILVLAFYIVVEEDAWKRLFRRLAPDEYQPYLSQLFSKMQTKIGLWLRGQLILMLVVGVASYLGLLLLGVPYALVLGLLAGLLEIIPYAGPTLSAIPALVIAFGESPFKAAMVLILFIIIQQIENHILIPKVMQKVTGLNPIVSIVALLVGFKLAGIPGAALSIPLATMISVFVYDVLGDPERETAISD